MKQTEKRWFFSWLNSILLFSSVLGNSADQNQIMNEKTSGLIDKKIIHTPNLNCNILICGGGYSPSGNQISLESNVKYFQRIKDKIGLKAFKSKVLFADGSNPARDLQFFDPKFIVPKTNLIIAETFGSTRGIYNQYRSNQLQTHGISSEKEIDAWIDGLEQVSPHSLNLIYFTGHGGKADKKETFNTTAYLWDNKKLKVSDFAKKMNKMPQEQSTILIMVQCYSGGYANVIFKDGDPVKGLHEHARAGFFATVHDRVAAGCTPDIREENYQEYSTRFWEALSGESRLGKKINKPDYDQDGNTSLLEAHSYVIIHSNTIDVPVKTSDVFLRKFSSTQPPKDQSTSIHKLISDFVKRNLPSTTKSVDKNASQQKSISPKWLVPSAPIEKITAGASSESNAIVSQLSKRLKLTKPDRFREVEININQLKKKREDLNKKKKEKENQKKELQAKIKNRLKKEWPEFSNQHHPMIDFIKQEKNSKKILQLANINNDYEKMLTLKAEISAIQNQRFRLEKEQILNIRLKREIENIVLEVALPKINTPDIVQRYKELLSLEKTVLNNRKNLK